MTARLLLTCGIWWCVWQTAAAQYPNIELDLPTTAVSNRSTLVTRIDAGKKKTYALLEGPGCIRHIWATMSRNDGDNRNVIVRIYFDGEKVPHVEAPLGDFFGAMHGKAWYPVDTPFLSVQAKSGYNCYFPMPFATSARIEFEVGEPQAIYCQVDWHSYPDQELTEPLRFCTRWRREFPTTRYGEDFLMLDADGPGRLVGFVYGVRLIDNVDRWSHGGSDNIYIDGDGRHPAFLRGIGGEDTFGTSYGGSMHTPRTHLNAGMPFYQQFDDGTARPSKNITGYRWFLNDSIRFEKSIHMRFGCMSNDICSTVYWYQEGTPRPFYRMPDFEHLTAGRSSKPVLRGVYDLPLPDRGDWWIVPEPLDLDAVDKAARTALPADTEFPPPEWIKRPSFHGFVDFGHVHRPHKRGAGVFHEATATARCRIHTEEAISARLRFSWDDRLVVRVNESAIHDLGHRQNFGSKTIDVPLRAGDNLIDVTLSNTRNFNHGGWVVGFHATGPDGSVLLPVAAQDNQDEKASP